MFKIEPITPEGRVDVKFFGSDEYSSYRDLLELYLKAEGFDTLDEQFVIEIMDHTWMVKPVLYHEE